VQVSSVSERVTVDAVDCEVDIRGAQSEVSVTLERGTLRLENLNRPATVSGAEVGSINLARLAAGARLTLSESAVLAESVGPLELDLDRTTLEVSGATGRVAGNVVEGRVRLVSVRGGGSLRLEDTPLEIERSRGSFEIETDADLAFKALEGSLSVQGFGGAVSGDGHTGEVTVANRDASVVLQNITGPIVLSGEGLDVTLAGISNAVTMELVGSSVTAERLKGALEIRNEYGDVSVKGIDGTAKITNRNGNVSVLDLSGTAEIDAEGPEVRVGWSLVGTDRDSRIENGAGDLFVVVPDGSAARVDAKAKGIESDFDELQISDDGRHANALLGNAEKPILTLYASGRLVVSRAE
jgi:hypothetical protein